MSFASFVQGVSPFGPIFGKELRTTARRKRTYFLRVVYLLLLLLVLLGAFSVTSAMGRYGGVAARNQQRSEQGQIFFAFFGVFTVFIVGLIGPVLTSTAISSERLHKTLPVLLMTPITAWQIVAGKLFSRLLVSITLIGLGLPVLALVRLLGGVELEQMVEMVALALVATISSAAIGLFFSTLLNRAYAVILLSFGAMLFLYAFTPFVIALTWHLLAPRSNGFGAAKLIFSIHPYSLAIAVAVPQGTGRLIGTDPVIWCASTHLGLSALLLMFSAMILRRRARREGMSASPAPVPVLNRTAAVPPPLPPTPTTASTPASASQATSPQSFPLAVAAQPRPPAARKSREVADNPILWRELRRPLMSRRWQRITGIVICAIMLAIVYALLAAGDSLKEPGGQAAWACVFNFLIGGIILVVSATAIAQEKESDTWTLLLATPVSGSTIVFGKALGIARRLFWPMALIAAHFLIFAVAGIITFWDAFVAIWVIATFNTLWIATGIYFSLRFSKVTLAVIANLALAICAYVLVLTVFAAFSDVDFHDTRPGPYAVMRYEWLNYGTVVFFYAVLTWWLVTTFLAVRRPRGALGQLLLATIVLYGSYLIPARQKFALLLRIGHAVLHET